MKTINKYRKAKYFNLTSTDVEYILAVRDFLKARGDQFIAIVPTETMEACYTVRVFNPAGAMADYVVQAFTHKECELLEEKVLSMTAEEYRQYQGLPPVDKGFCEFCPKDGGVCNHCGGSPNAY